MQWEQETQEYSGRGRLPQDSSQQEIPSAAPIETSANLDIIGRKVGNLPSRQNETEGTTNVLVTQLQSMLTAIQEQQVMLTRHGVDMAGRQKMAEEASRKLAIQQEWMDKQHQVQLFDQERLQDIFMNAYQRCSDFVSIRSISSGKRICAM